MMGSIISIVGIIVTIIAAVVSVIYGKKSVNSARETAEKKNRLNTFLEYTRRYQEIVRCLHSDPENRPDNMRLYFNLCQEEFYLHQKGTIDDTIWNLWVEEMRTMMNNQQNPVAWKELGSHFPKDDFVSFMHQEVIAKVRQ